MARMNFNANDVDPSTTFEVINEGWYTAELYRSEMKQTKAGDGAYLALQFKIIDGENKGRIIFTRLNLENKNPTAVEIAERNFSQLCHAVGVLIVKDSQQLHGIPLKIKVGVTPPQGSYEAKNDIKGYRALDETPEFADTGDIAEEEEEVEEEEEIEEEIEEEEEEIKPKQRKKKVTKKKVAKKKATKKVQVEEEDDDDMPAWLKDDEEEE